MSRFFALGDVHSNATGEMRYLEAKQFPEKKELTKEDIVFQLGDFGFYWYYDTVLDLRTNDFKRLNLMAAENFTYFVIPGNHDNYDLIMSLPVVEKFGGRVYSLVLDSGTMYFAIRGEVYTINDKTFFTFSGAKSGGVKGHKTLEMHESGKYYSFPKYRYGEQVGIKQLRVKLSQINYWAQELATEEEYEYALANLALHNYEVDYILTHTCPRDVLEMSLDSSNEDYVSKFNDPTTDFFDKIQKRISFKEWHFGHLHNNFNYVDLLGRKYFCHYKTKPTEFGRED